ncbi:MAG: phytanoyl-CoA dioxygenase family protein [bacterium]|nr:phytanoyl-CoA dioxygenase family protein [bacterium]
MAEATIPEIDPNEVIDFMNVDQTDFGSFTLGQQIRHLEAEGYVVLPDMLDADHIAKLKSELADMPMRPKPYSEYLTTGAKQPQWFSRAVAELIGHPPMIEFLTKLMGPDIVFTRGFFQRTNPGSPGISMHTDGQPFGSSIFNYEGSSPKMLRVLYYLDDLIPARAPFRLIPRSHLSYHAQANPYVRYKSHPEEITVCAKAGSALLIPINMFHATHPNTDSSPRELIQFGYRPAWAGPIQPMKEWDPELVAAAPEQAKPFFQSLNTTGGTWGLEHKPEGMTTEAPGINPSRWED